MSNKVDNLDADIKAQVQSVPANVRSEYAQAVSAFAIAEKAERDASAAYEEALKAVRSSLPDSKETALRVIDARKKFDKAMRDNAAIWEAFFKRADKASGFGINRDAVRDYVCGKKGISLVAYGEGCVALKGEDGSGRVYGPMKKAVEKVLNSFTPPKDPEGDAVVEIESAITDALPDGFADSMLRLIDLRKDFDLCTKRLDEACERVGAAYRNLKEAELRETYSISNAVAAQERRDLEKKERIAKLRAEADKLEAESRRG